MNGRAWTTEDLKVLMRLYPHHPSAWVAGQLNHPLDSVNGMASKLKLRKDPVYKAQAWRWRGMNINEAGKPYRFPKGHAPANKGTRRPGWFVGRMKETQFKKGNRRSDTAPIGGERLIDGYLYVKMAEVPCVAYTVNWKAVHILNWERANGRPLPSGHCLAFRDRDRMNVAVENLELITRRERMLRNSIHRLPPELVHVVQIRAALVRQINKRSRHEKQN